jgi:hypothetical protein
MSTTASSGAEATMPSEIERSLLMRMGGFAVYEGILDDQLLDLLRIEASAARAFATANETFDTWADEWRGGQPARKFLSAPGGPVQDAFYHAPWLSTTIREVTGLQVTPTGPRGTFTYYARRGDFLALHRDVKMCDIALITCLTENAHQVGEGGLLRLYPQRNGEPLSAIRSEPDRSSVHVRLVAGQTLIMLGGIVAHELLPVAEHQARIVSVLCFEVLAPQPGIRAMYPVDLSSRAH